MDLFDRLQEQISSVRLPLFAVTVSAVAQVNTPLVALLHWHGFRRATPLVLPGVEIPPRPVPASAFQIDAPWHDFEAVDTLLLDAAWQCGAWELERIERRGCNEIGASAAEALACRQAFGDYADGGQHLIDAAAEREQLMELAARKGYLRWLFRPVLGGLWREPKEAQAPDDDTLDRDGGRRSPCPVRPQPRGNGNGNGKATGRRIVYRLGSVRRLWLPR